MLHQHEARPSHALMLQENTADDDRQGSLFGWAIDGSSARTVRVTQKDEIRKQQSAGAQVEKETCETFLLGPFDSIVWLDEIY